MGEVGKFVILNPNARQDPVETFEDHRHFDRIFNESYDDIERALLLTDLIVEKRHLLEGDYSRNKLQELASTLKPSDPTERPEYEYKDRLASFPKNLKYVAKKMALYFWNNGISLSSINQIQGFVDPTVEVVIISILHYFLIEIEDEDIFERIYQLIKMEHRTEHSLEFKVFFTLIDKFNMPPGHGFFCGPANVHSYENRIRIYERITKAVNQLSTMIGLSGFLNADSPQLDQMPSERRQELINLLQDTSIKVRIYAIIGDGPEPPPSAQVMSMIGSQAQDDKPLQVKNAEAVERIRSKMASRYSRRHGGKRRKSSNHTQRRKKQHKKTVKRRS